MAAAHPTGLAKRLLAAALLLLGQAAAFTYPNQTEVLLNFKQKVLQRGPNWPPALETWTCPTNTSSNPNGSCDPCGTNSWWGNFDHIGCRGDTIEAKDELGGTGFVTNVHITDLHIEGPVPARDLCALKHLKEFDLDGGDLTGPIPALDLIQCFPLIDEIDLSYNQITGTIPPEIGVLTKLDEFKVEHNNLTGTIPAELSNMAELKWLRFADNNLHGTVPPEFSKQSELLVQLTLDGNQGIKGNLYMLSNHHLVNVGTANTKLCGMVPVGVRFAHNFNPHNTGLGLPCPDELAQGWPDEP